MHVLGIITKLQGLSSGLVETSCEVRKRDQFVRKGRNEEWVRNGADIMF
jgi:hypothetical protein